MVDFVFVFSLKWVVEVDLRGILRLCSLVLVYKRLGKRNLGRVC